VGLGGSGGLYLRVVRIGLPIVIGCDESARSVIHAEDWIPQQSGNPEAAERWPQRAKRYGLGFASSDDETADQNVVTDRNDPSSREVKRLRPKRRKLRALQMQGNRVVGSITTGCRILIIENLVASGIQAQELSEGGKWCSTINKGVIN